MIKDGDEECRQFIAELARKVFERLSGYAKVPYSDQGIPLLREAFDEVWAATDKEVFERGMVQFLGNSAPTASGLHVQTCELVDGVLRVVASRPIEWITIESAVAAALTPPCDPSNPCGCHGCATCNSAQAPTYGFFGAAPVGSTPAYGSPAVACTCGSATCNKCRAQRGMGPAGVTPARGSAKPGGGGSPKTRAANAERGYRVLSYSAWLNREDGSREGDSFSTPDLATQRARRDAKAGKETYIVLRDGARWKLLKQDGDEVVVG